MENNPNFDNIEVSERPKNKTKTGEIVSVIKATRKELYNLDDDAQPKFGSLDDEIVQLEALVEHKGHEFTVYEDLRFYENPSDRSMFGRFINRYGTPEKGLEVNIDFDGDGEGKVVGIRD